MLACSPLQRRVEDVTPLKCFHLGLSLSEPGARRGRRERSHGRSR
jgi:hypothetical protein